MTDKRKHDSDDVPASDEPERKRMRTELKAVECFNVQEGIRIVVEVQEDKIHPGKYFVDGLRDAIADKEKYEGRASAIKIYSRNTDGARGSEIKDGELPDGAFVFELTSASTSPHRETMLSKEHPVVAFINLLKDWSMNENGLLIPTSGRSLLQEDMTLSLATNSLLVRASYSNVVKTLKKKSVRTLLITGTPGVGKSTLRLYILWLWLTSQDFTEYTCVDFDVETSEKEGILIYRLPDSTLQFFQHYPRVYANDFDYLHAFALLELCPADTRCQGFMTHGPTLICGSGDAKEKYGNHLNKVAGFKQHVEPLWTEDELKLIAPDFDEKRYELYGGVPRLVVQLPAEEAKEYIKQAIEALRKQIIGGIAQSQHDPRPKHRILKIEMTTDTDGVTLPRAVDFISAHVWRKMMHVSQENRLKDAKEWSLMMNGVGWGKSVSGQMFETYFHIHFAKGDNASAIQINGVPVTCTSLVECSKEELKNPTTGTHDKCNVLYVPIARNNPTWDSYFVVADSSTSSLTIVFLQLTVGATHSAGDWTDMSLIANFIKNSHGIIGKSISATLMYVVPNNSQMTTPPAISNMPKKDWNVTVALQKVEYDF